MPTITLSGTTTNFPNGTTLPRQRDADNVTDVSVSGTYGDGTPTHIEWSIGGAYQTLTDEVISGGSWSGKLPGLVGQEVTLTLRWSNSTGTTVSTKLLLGEIFLIGGDSVAESSISVGAGANTTPHSYRWNGAANGYVLRDSNNYVGNFWAQLGDEFVALLNVPVMFVNGAQSGTDTGQWVPGAGGTWTTFLSRVTDCKADRFRAVLWHLGSNNVTRDVVPITSNIQSILAGVAANVPGLSGGGPPSFFALIGEVADPPNDRANLNSVRSELLALAANGTISIGPNLIDQDYADGIHPAGSTQGAQGAHRWTAAVADAFFGTSFGRGPRQAGATINGAKTTVVVTADRDLGNSLASSVAGFRVFDGGSPVSLSSQTVTGVRQVTIALAAPIAGACTVSFASGNDATGATVPHTATETLPSTATMTRPMEPFYGLAATASASRRILFRR